MSCYLLIRNKETGEGVGIATCNYPEREASCFEYEFEHKKELCHLETEHITGTEYETYKALKLFREYTRTSIGSR